MMRLGIVLTDDALTEHAVGLAEAALARGWEVRAFLTDRGVVALADEPMNRLLEDHAVQVAVCELSVDRYGEEVPPAERLEAAGVVVGGQYQDAELVRQCGRTVVL